MTYLSWNTKKVTDPSEAVINTLYDEGYVATRVEKGLFNQTRSARIRLADFELSSENRRILRKVEHLTLETHPLPYKEYHWSIHKLAKDFYTTKFGADTFSANKVRELLQSADKSNFNTLLVYRDKNSSQAIGYCIALQTDKILHYSYPFYVQDPTNPSIGLGMMTLAIEWAKASGLIYISLGSLQRPSDTYKLQFSGLEWFNGQIWQKDNAPLRDILK